MGRLWTALKHLTNLAWHVVVAPPAFLIGWGKRRLGWLGPIEVVGYRGFGDAERLHVLGRVREAWPIPSPEASDPWWRNLRSVVRRFRTVTVPDVCVSAQIGGVSVTGRTDDQGYFDLQLPTPEGFDMSAGWHRVDLELAQIVRRRQPVVQSTAKVLLPCSSSAFGVVSDIDDTVVYSHATDLWKLIKLTTLHNARTRTPLAGAAEFYQALQRGADGLRRNPFFYVSSSAWNLYDLVQDFLAFHGFPEGPLLMRDFSMRNRRLLQSNHNHKVEKVERIFATTGDLPFLLIGDAGQHDPELYHRIAREFPGRVAAIYIRAVSWLDRSAEVERLAKDLRGLGVEMLLVEDTKRAAEHAAARGFIASDAVDAIALDRRADRARARRA